MKPIRDGKHLMFLRSLPCVTCGSSNTQAAHIRRGSNAGMGQKPSDNRAVPLCAACHLRQHTVGEISFWSPFGGYEKAAVLANKLYEVRFDIKAALELIARFR